MALSSGRTAEINDASVITDIDIHVLAQIMGATIAGGDIQRIQERRLGNFPSQCMLATAGTDQQYVHSAFRPCSCSGWGLAREAAKRAHCSDLPQVFHLLYDREGRG